MAHISFHTSWRIVTDACRERDLTISMLDERFFIGDTKYRYVISDNRSDQSVAVSTLDSAWSILFNWRDSE